MFHWLKCSWDKWSEPKPQAMRQYDRWTKDTVNYWVVLQIRRCKVCNKVEEREVKEYK